MAQGEYRRTIIQGASARNEATAKAIRQEKAEQRQKEEDARRKRKEKHYPKG